MRRKIFCQRVFKGYAICWIALKISFRIASHGARNAAQAAPSFIILRRIFQMETLDEGPNISDLPINDGVKNFAAPGWAELELVCSLVVERIMFTFLVARLRNLNRTSCCTFWAFGPADARHDETPLTTALLQLFAAIASET